MSDMSGSSDTEQQLIAEYVAMLDGLAHVVVELSKGKELSKLPAYVRDAIVWAWARTEHWPDADVQQFDGSGGAS